MARRNLSTQEMIRKNQLKLNRYKFPAVSRRKITPSKLLRAIQESHGLYTVIAKRLKCTPTTVKKALIRPGRAWNHCRRLYEEECEKVGDIAEDTLIRAMKQTVDINVASRTAQWYLQQKGKQRGYSDSRTVKVEGGENPVRVNQLQVTIPATALNLPVNMRKKLLETIDVAKEEYQEKQNGSNDGK